MRKLVLVLIVSLIGCAGVPDVAPRGGWYAPGSTDLLDKAYGYEVASLAHVNSQGLLLYTAWDPRTWGPEGDGWTNYIESHDIADAPAWQGHLMASLAFAQAVDGKDRNGDIKRLILGLKEYYDITGVPGVWGRTYMSDYVGPRLPWMEDETQDPTKFWAQGAGGRWWRNGLAKNHFNSAICGLAITLELHNRGDIKLNDDTLTALLDVLRPAVVRFVENDFNLTEPNGEVTEFGSLGPQVLNGFNMIITLNALKSMSAYDANIKSIYEDKSESWGSRIDFSMSMVGWFMYTVGHWNFEKPSYSDMQAFGFAATSLLLQEPNSELADDIENALDGLWTVMNWERNANVTIPYYYFVKGCTGRGMNDIIEDLRDFPTAAQKIGVASGRDDTDEVQPLINRPTNSNYYKSSPYRRALPPHDPVVHPNTGAVQYFSGQDYLLTYWMGRYFRLVPER